MEYEKLKELEKSGFPQIETDGGKIGCQHEHDGIHITGKVYTRDCCHLVFNPTTDELIEQLGDKYWKLIKEDDDFLAYQRGSITYFKGKTPKEALINLYIAVNKK